MGLRADERRSAGIEIPQLIDKLGKVVQCKRCAYARCTHQTKGEIHMRIIQTTALGSIAASAALATNSSGLLPGMVVPVMLHSPAGAVVGTAILQTSVDGTTWTTAVDAAGANLAAVTTIGPNMQSVRLAQFIRLNMTAWTSGNLMATVFSDIA